MTRTILTLGLALMAVTSAPRAFHDDDDDSRSAKPFRLLATFNVPGSTSAEIASATPDGRLVVYSDALGAKFGLVDISNPSTPQQIGTVAVDGSPTSVATLPDGRHAVGCVQTGSGGQLVLIRLWPLAIIGQRTIGTGPDAVAVTRIGSQNVAVIAIENEGAEKGHVEIVRLNLASFATSPVSAVRFDDPAALVAAGLLHEDDPQPEFVSIRGSRAAVTLQENNGIAIINISNPAVPRLEKLFSTGVASNRRADLSDDQRIAFVDEYPADVASQPNAGARIPDAVGWSSDGTTLFTADEGEESFEGGRGWSAHSSSGGWHYDDEGELERAAVRFGHYPDGRSDAKGIEAEGLAVAKYGHREFLFVTSERGSFIAVYRLDGRDRPHFVQLLGTGQAPESVVPIPSRNLLLTANEGGDDGDGSISIFAMASGESHHAHDSRDSDRGPSSSDKAQISSHSVTEPWGALSGLAADPRSSELLYAVPDDALPSSIFSIRTGGPDARIRELVKITNGGTQALYDLEGITVDTSLRRPSRNPGFWVVSEGNGTTTSNILVQTDAFGRVSREIFLPADVDGGVARKITSNGFEGVTVSGDRRYLVVAIQRPFRGDVAVGGVVHTRIARYDLVMNRWEAFFYPLVTAPGTIGLSEISVVGRTHGGADVYAVIERDNRLAASANIKRIYAFTLEGLTPVDIGALADASSITGATVSKRLLRDILPHFTPYEKVEGLAVTPRGEMWVVLDNDGGEFESRFVRFRN